MSLEFTIDMDEFLDAIKKAPETVGKGAVTALGDIKDDWVREARNIAPHDTGNLRRQIHGDVKGTGVDSFVEIEANAFSDTGGKRFNYAYYIHEGHMRAAGKRLRKPGTVEQFLKESAEKREKDYEKWMREDIEEALRKDGW